MHCPKELIIYLPLTKLKKGLRRVRKRDSESRNFSLELPREERPMVVVLAGLLAQRMEQWDQLKVMLHIS